jgi:hypothetical protein
VSPAFNPFARPPRAADPPPPRGFSADEERAVAAWVESGRVRRLPPVPRPDAPPPAFGPPGERPVRLGLMPDFDGALRGF